MATPTHQTPKIGRNQKCPCGSGKKYKHCHGQFGASTPPPGFREAVQAHLREHKANEIVRTRQQGYGRPIIATRINDHWAVGVGGSLFYGKTWLFFTDFLLHYLKEVLGREWGAKAQKTGLDHPVFRWLRRLNDDTVKFRNARGSVISRPELG